MNFNKQTVERILNTLKLSDHEILTGNGVKITKYGREFEINQVNWFYNWDKFCLHFGLFINYLQATSNVRKLPEGSVEIKPFRDMFRTTISNAIYGKKAFNELIKLYKIEKLDVRFMKKHFGIDDWVEIFLYIYIFNIWGCLRRLNSRVRSDFSSPVQLTSSKTDIYLHLKKTFTVDEIKQLTALQVALIIQRQNEPLYKEAIDSEIRRVESQSNKGRK